MNEPDQMQKKMLRTQCAGGGSSPVLESIPPSAQTGKDGSWKWTVWATETSLASPPPRQGGRMPGSAFSVFSIVVSSFLICFKVSQP